MVCWGMNNNKSFYSSFISFEDVMSRKAHNKHITCWLGDDDIAAGTLSSKREDEKNWTSSDPRVIVQKPYDTCATVSCLTSFINSWSKLFCLWQAPLIALSIWFKSLLTVCCWLHFSLIQPQCLQVLCFTDATERSSTVEEGRAWRAWKVFLCVRASHLWWDAREQKQERAPETVLCTTWCS